LRHLLTLQSPYRKLVLSLMLGCTSRDR
jgi:hypothetical protein